MLQIIIESFSFCFAIFMGLRAYAKLRPFHKLILFQLITWFLVYLTSYGITIYQQNNYLPKNNQWLFNLYMFAETLLLAVAAYVQLVSKKRKRILYVFLFLFFIAFVIQLAHDGPGVFANYACAVESIFLTIAFLLVLYEQFQILDHGFIRSPVIITCLAFIVFYGCNAPYFSFFGLLQKSYPYVSLFLFHLIIDVLSNIRYLLLAWVFWLILKDRQLIMKPDEK